MPRRRPSTKARASMEPSAGIATASTLCRAPAFPTSATPPPKPTSNSSPSSSAALANPAACPPSRTPSSPPKSAPSRPTSCLVRLPQPPRPPARWLRLRARQQARRIDPVWFNSARNASINHGGQPLPVPLVGHASSARVRPLRGQEKLYFLNGCCMKHTSGGQKCIVKTTGSLNLDTSDGRNTSCLISIDTSACCFWALLLPPQ